MNFLNYQPYLSFIFSAGGRESIIHKGIKRGSTLIRTLENFDLRLPAYVGGRGPMAVASPKGKFG